MTLAPDTPAVSGLAARHLSAHRVDFLRVCDGLSGAVAQYAIPVLVYHLTGSPTWAGAAFTLEWLSRLLALTTGGSLVDRHSPRTVMIVSVTARTVMVLAGIAALASGIGPVSLIVLGIGLGILAEITYLTAEQLGARAGATPRVRATQTAIDQGTSLIGPLLGGILLLAGQGAALAAVAALSLAATGTALSLPAVNAYRQVTPPGSALRAGPSALLALPVLCWMTGAFTSMNLLAGILQAASPVLVGAWHRSPVAVGIVWSVSAAAALIAASATTLLLRHLGPLRPAVAACFCGAVATAAAALAPCYGAFTAALALLAVAEGTAMVLLRTARARLLPAPVFGAGVAVMVLVLLAPLPIGGLLLALTPHAALPAVLLAAAAQGLARHREALTATFLRPDRSNP